VSVESTTTIAGLNALWPQGTDVKAEGDDHLRLIKSVLKTDAVDKAQFATAVVATAQARNRIVNGAMQISQEAGNTNLGGSGQYPADQFGVLFVTTGTINFQRVQVVTPNGSANRLRVVIVAADTSLAAGEYLFVQSAVEGIRVADFRWGSASAKQVVLRFWWKSPAGTYSVMVGNGSAPTRSYIANFTVSAGQANTDTEQTLVIPGDTSGTWPTDTSAGLLLRICMASGTTFQGAAGWQAGNVFATSATSNGMASTSNVYELFDVGLYLDPLATGVAPRWEMPDEAQELAACQRYFNRILGAATGGYHLGGNSYYEPLTLSSEMRIAPALAFDAWSYSNASGVAMQAVSLDTIVFKINNTGGGGAYGSGNINCNARM
jgi:hypothetical protein